VAFRRHAGVAVAALTGDALTGRTLTLTGPASLTFRRQLAVIAGLLGREVDVEQVDREQAVRSLCVRPDGIDVILTQPIESDHPATAYVDRHGDGVANIGLRVPDASAAFSTAVFAGARPAVPPSERNGIVTAAVFVTTGKTYPPLINSSSVP
jgi:hypothetical protein